MLSGRVVGWGTLLVNSALRLFILRYDYARELGLIRSRSPVQYALALGCKVIGIDAGDTKRAFIESLGAKFIDIASTKSISHSIVEATNGGAHAIIITTPHPGAFKDLSDMLRVGGSLCTVGIPPGNVFLDVPVAAIVIKGLRVQGNLVGSLGETKEAVEFVRDGRVKPHVVVRGFGELDDVYGELERGEILGRVVLEL